MKKLSSFLMSMLAGGCIAVGGVVFLSVENKVLGALLFSVGLFTVCTFSFPLFTGKIGYVVDGTLRDLGFALFVWVGNLAGAVLVGYAVRLTRIAVISERALSLCQTKLSDTPLSIFILSVFCNFLVFISVDGYRNNPHEIGKYLSILFGVVTFIVCGFEHCVANMFYFSVADAWSIHALLYLLLMTLGNAVGGMLIPLCRKLNAAALTGSRAV